MSSHSALLVIDAQVNMFDEGYPVFEGEEILSRIGGLITTARLAQTPIIYVQNNGREGDPDQPHTPGWQIHPALTPAVGDVVIQKDTPDAFYNTPLPEILESGGITRLVVVGMQSDICIDVTCHRAFALGYDITLVKDAHSTFDSEDRTAAQIIAHHNEVLGAFVNLAEAADVVFNNSVPP